jgi:hypothetical protein
MSQWLGRDLQVQQQQNILPKKGFNAPLEKRYWHDFYSKFLLS